MQIAWKKYRIFWKLEPWKIILLPLMDKLKAKLYVLDRYRSESIYAANIVSGIISFSLYLISICNLDLTTAYEIVERRYSFVTRLVNVSLEFCIVAKKLRMPFELCTYLSMQRILLSPHRNTRING